MPVIAMTSTGSHMSEPNRSTKAKSLSVGIKGSSRAATSIAYTRSVTGSENSGGKRTFTRSSGRRDRLFVPRSFVAGGSCCAIWSVRVLPSALMFYVEHIS